MSTPGTQPLAAGWYPDPAGTGGQRWHDGQGWTARVVHGTTERKTLGTGFARLGDWLGRLLAVWGVLYVLLALVMVFFWLNPPDLDLSTTTLPGDPGVTAPTSGSDPGASGIGIAINLGIFAVSSTIAVLWLVWQYQLAAAAPRRLRNSPGGHVGWWFVPLANLVVPRRAIGDLWHAYEMRRTGEPMQPTPWAFSVWWALWLSPILMFPLLILTVFRAPTVEDAATSILGLVALFLFASAGAAFTGRLVVRDLSWRALLYHSTAS